MTKGEKICLTGLWVIVLPIIPIAAVCIAVILDFALKAMSHVIGWTNWFFNTYYVYFAIVGIALYGIGFMVRMRERKNFNESNGNSKEN